MKRNIILIKETHIDVSSIESFETKNIYMTHFNAIYKLIIVMKSGYVYTFNFDDKEEREMYFNELIQKWSNI